VILVDTNVLIALMVDGRDSQRQAALVQLERLKAEADVALVCEGVLVEACWVLERSYRLGRSEVAVALRTLISTPPLRSWDPALTDASLELMARRPALSVTDCLLLRRSADTGDPVMSFDTGIVRELGRST
jgi:predicted nucleic acid-binding protein